ncbi:MAG: TolC family protein [Kofleriaceae bacterium]
MKWLFALALAACVPSQHELADPVDALIHARSGVERDKVDLDALLAKPLDADAAVKIALANNARLAAALDDLGIAGGELAQALGLGPLAIDGKLRFGSHGHEYEVDAVQNVLTLVTAPRRRAAAHADLAAARATAAATALQLAARVEIAFHDYIAAQQSVELRRTAFDAADAAATVRERMHDAGNTTELALARERAAREQARVELARAEAELERRREPIDASLGLSGARTRWTTTGMLLDPPEAAPAVDDLETASVAASLELATARDLRDATANRAGAETVDAILPELGVGVSAIDRDGEIEVGPAIRIGIPLFDQRAGQRAKADAAAARSEHELSATAVELRARARSVRVAVLAAHAEARHLHEVVLPLRQQIVDQTLLHYNAMDADPFALIVARRDLVDAGAQYLEALRRYADAMTEVTALRRGVMIRRSDDRQP